MFKFLSISFPQLFSKHPKLPIFYSSSIFTKSHVCVVCTVIGPPKATDRNEGIICVLLLEVLLAGDSQPSSLYGDPLD